jgi:hypothetical protein
MSVDPSYEKTRTQSAPALPVLGSRQSLKPPYARLSTQSRAAASVMRPSASWPLVRAKLASASQVTSSTVSYSMPPPRSTSAARATGTSKVASSAASRAGRKAGDRTERVMARASGLDRRHSAAGPWCAGGVTPASRQPACYIGLKRQA